MASRLPELCKHCPYIQFPILDELINPYELVRSVAPIGETTSLGYDPTTLAALLDVSQGVKRLTMAGDHLLRLVRGTARFGGVVTSQLSSAPVGIFTSSTSDPEAPPVYEPLSGLSEAPHTALDQGYALSDARREFFVFGGVNDSGEPRALANILSLDSGEWFDLELMGEGVGSVVEAVYDGSRGRVWFLAELHGDMRLGFFGVEDGVVQLVARLDAWSGAPGASYAMAVGFGGEVALAQNRATSGQTTVVIRPEGESFAFLGYTYGGQGLTDHLFLLPGGLLLMAEQSGSDALGYAVQRVPWANLVPEADGLITSL